MRASWPCAEKYSWNGVKVAQEALGRTHSAIEESYRSGKSLYPGSTSAIRSRTREGPTSGMFSKNRQNEFSAALSVKQHDQLRRE